MSSSKIVVVGSSNTDLTIKMDNLPKPGETVLGYEFMKSQGGKGANQAVAAARAGADVTLITKMGKDEFGYKALESFKNEGIATASILMDEDSYSGLAMIWVDKYAENSIAVVSGANANLSPLEIMKMHEVIESAEIMIVQLEIPIETVEKAIEIAYARNVTVIVNPAPANKLSAKVLEMIDVITPNIHELESLSGIGIQDVDDIKEAANQLLFKGIKNVVVTNGSKGSFLINKDVFMNVPAFNVSAVDTTAAGDILNGAFAAALLDDRNMADALLFANAAAALSVTRLGAQKSAPKKEEVLEFLNNQSK